MLTEERFARILSIVDSKGSVTVAELIEEMGSSESTVRRDLLTLDKQGRLRRVRGGATSLNTSLYTKDNDVRVRDKQHGREKSSIGSYAAELVGPDDFVYIDAGTSTQRMLLPKLSQEASYVTNSVSHAMKLAALGRKVYILGGEFKRSTEAIVGEEAIYSISKYNFTKGFFGTNAVNISNGFTTPEMKEAAIKRCAMDHCIEKYVLCDSSKFDQTSSISFAEFSQAIILTDHIKSAYKGYTNIKEVKNK
ncbi:MAG: DeoR/GlpR family DNA-binding transcription regulator [Lachnospiraceae bacterium]|nr:DeoR/GlpR family DNA-binding transcription regulator [Lachnospiraceae bacterium]